MTKKQTAALVALAVALLAALGVTISPELEAALLDALSAFVGVE